MPDLEYKPLLRCLECNRQFTLLDVKEGSYAGGTGICMDCYAEMQRDVERCFGKKNERGRPGYDPTAIECQKFCPDKTICAEFVKEIKKSGKPPSKVFT